MMRTYSTLSQKENRSHYPLGKKIAQGFAAIAIGLFLQACEHKELSQIAPNAIPTNQAQINNVQKAFAKALVMALKNDSELRSFLKEEAQKQFDGDYDILYQMIKNKPINNGPSLHERLANQITASELVKIEETSPLLTIFIPELPNGFSPITWNTQNEIPVVAISLLGDNSIPFYNADGAEELIPKGHIPGFPTLLIKQNERVSTSPIDAESTSLEFYKDADHTYYFGNKAYDGRHAIASRKENTTADRVANVYQFDPKAVDAYFMLGTDKNRAWQRDYVYYNITPWNANGVLDQNYKEYLQTIKFSNDALGVISDQTGDPRLTSMVPAQSNFWTEGRFELQISVLINAKNGVGPRFDPLITVNPNSLYDITYSSRVINMFPAPPRTFWLINSITPKELVTSIPLLAWDLQNVSTAWVFVVNERDASGTDTKTYVNNSSIATNFEINSTGGIGPAKLGGKFGVTSTTSSSATHQVSFNLGDDDLGPTILNFNDLIFTSNVPGPPFTDITTYEINNGPLGLYSLSIEPRR